MEKVSLRRVKVTVCNVHMLSKGDILKLIKLLIFKCHLVPG